MERNCAGCGHDHCGACCGNACAGCGTVLRLTRDEIDLLLCFAQIPFLPVARRTDSDEPIYLEEKTPEEMARAIAALESKRLIQLDYDLPLSNFDYAAYQAYPIRGSMTLTALGQRVAEQLEIQGIEA